MQRLSEFLDRLPETRRPRLWLLLLCLALWLPGFFTLPATDRDEARFAQATKQMVDTGDYVRIRVGEEERNKKPAGIHWLQAASVHLVEAAHLGTRRDIWPYRVPRCAASTRWTEAACSQWMPAGFLFRSSVPTRMRT